MEYFNVELEGHFVAGIRSSHPTFFNSFLTKPGHIWVCYIKKTKIEAQRDLWKLVKRITKKSPLILKEL